MPDRDLDARRLDSGTGRFASRMGRMSVEPEVLIRRARPADAGALARLGARTFTETFGHLYAPEDLAAFLADTHTPARHARLLADPAVAIWLAALATTGPVAYAVAGPCELPLAAPEPRAGELRKLYVLQAHQNRHLGTRLLAMAFEWLEQAGYTTVYIGVWSKNVGAQRLYGRHGFTKSGEYDFPVGRHIDREFILRRDRHPASGLGQSC